MRSFVVVLFLLFCLLAFAGCQKNAIHNNADVVSETSNVVQGDVELESMDNSNGKMENAVSMAENPGQMALNGLSHLAGSVKIDNDIVEIRIQSNPTTGYQWTWHEDSEGKMLSNIRDEFLPPSTGNDRGEMIAGASGIHEFEFRGIAEGVANLTFTYRRSWEPPSENDITYRLEVRVSEDGRILRVVQR